MARSMVINSGSMISRAVSSLTEAAASGREGALIRRCRRGDEEAWAELVRNHQDGVYRTAYRLLENHDDALEAAQETFLSAYRGMGGFRGDSSFRTWLITIAARQATGLLKRRRDWSVLDEEDTPGDDLANGTPADRETHDLILSAVRKLDTPGRVILILREFEGLAYREIAEALDLPLGTVESRLYRARARLRKILARELEGAL